MADQHDDLTSQQLGPNKPKAPTAPDIVSQAKSEGTTSSTPSSPGGQSLIIGDYRIIRKLGAGGMGIVYEAEQQHPKRLVALKVVKGGRFVDDQQVKLFEREAQALARLKHPGIAAIYGSGRTAENQQVLNVHSATK